MLQGHAIPAEPTLVNMSRSELSFALLVEEALVTVESPSRRQLCVELLCVLATILRRNPELYLQQALDLDKLLDDAHLTYAKVRPIIHLSNKSALYSGNKYSMLI